MSESPGSAEPDGDSLAAARIMSAPGAMNGPHRAGLGAQAKGEVTADDDPGQKAERLANTRSRVHVFEPAPPDVDAVRDETRYQQPPRSEPQPARCLGQLADVEQ